MQQTAATCPCQLRAMPISPPPDAYVVLVTCPCHSGHMPMSLWRHAYVTLARCLCHHLRHAYVAEVRCLCRQSDIGISPAPHQKRPVYRCSGRPFFVLFGHFRHEMRIFPASEASFGADGESMWPGAAGGRKPPLFAHNLRSLYTRDFSSAGGFVPAPSFLSSHGRHIC